MTKQYHADSLKAFAEKALHADRFPNDYHIFRTFECDTCGKVPFTLVIEHHTGSKENDFKGIIHGVCAQCNVSKQVFSFTGSHRQKKRSTGVTCTCGNDVFFTGECERFEGDEGLLGFFDEGVVVGQCSKCGKNQVLVWTD